MVSSWSSFSQRVSTLAENEGAVAVPDEVTDPLTAGFAYGSSSSVGDEMVNRFSHTHPLYK